MAIDEKRIDRLNNLPPAQRERKGLYIAIMVLFSGFTSSLGYINWQGNTYETRLSVERRNSLLCDSVNKAMAQSSLDDYRVQSRMKYQRDSLEFIRQIESDKAKAREAQRQFEERMGKAEKSAERANRNVKRTGAELSKIPSNEY